MFGCFQPRGVFSLELLLLLLLILCIVDFVLSLRTEWKIYNYFRRNISKLADGSMHGK